MKKLLVCAAVAVALVLSGCDSGSGGGSATLSENEMAAYAALSTAQDEAQSSAQGSLQAGSFGTVPGAQGLLAAVAADANSFSETLTGEGGVGTLVMTGTIDTSTFTVSTQNVFTDFEVLTDSGSTAVINGTETMSYTYDMSDVSYPSDGADGIASGMLVMAADMAGSVTVTLEGADTPLVYDLHLAMTINMATNEPSDYSFTGTINGVDASTLEVEVE